MSSRPIFLSAEWRKLVMANYVVDPKLLEPFLPIGASLDLWQDRCYISLVGFLFKNTKVLGIPIPWHRNFEEVNLRFYVKKEVDGELRRGVSFIQELVPKRAITWVANTLYQEKYCTRPTKHQWTITDEQLDINYQWRYDSNWSKLAVQAANRPSLLQAGSEEAFILEHYWGYTQLRGNKLGEYQVEHPAWEVYPVLDYQIEGNFDLQYGPSLGQAMQGRPSSIFLAEGSNILVRKGQQYLHP